MTNLLPPKGRGGWEPMREQVRQMREKIRQATKGGNEVPGKKRIATPIGPALDRRNQSGKGYPLEAEALALCF